MTRARRRVLRCATTLLAALIIGAAWTGAANAGIVFDGNFENGLTPWVSGGGGPQCANYGTVSKPPRMRGDFAFSSNDGEGLVGHSGQFSLPADLTPPVYPLEACDLVTGHLPDLLPSTSYFGLMIYVPAGWTIPNSAFFGVNIEELHFGGAANVVSPIALQLHPDHVTISVETGPCVTTGAVPGCQYRSNADNTSCRNSSSVTCLPGYYAIPPGQFVRGQWNELILGIHWASDHTGALQAWYRVKGAPTWQSGSAFSGVPTVQWDSTKGCCTQTYVDLLEAYTAALSAPMTVWLDNDLVSTDFTTVAALMPGGVLGGGGPPPFGGGGPPPPGGGGPPAGSPRPAVSAVSITPRVSAVSGRRVGRRCVRSSRANRHGRRCSRLAILHLSYRLTEPASLTMTVRRATGGRLDGGRCVPARAANQKARRCTRWVALPGALTRAGTRGVNRITLAAVFGGRRLGPGVYELILTPTAKGRRGVGRRVVFTLRL